MRALVVIIATILALAFDSSFGSIFTLRSVGSITPQAMPCLVVFIALFAPEKMALLVSLLLGALVDLSPGHGELVGGAHLIGPYALGYFVTTLFVLKIRNVVFRRRVFTLALLVVAAVITTGATEALVLLVRGLMPWTPPVTGGGFGDLAKLIGTSIYTGILAVPLGWCLLATIGVWRFHSPTGRRATWR
jgi:cell shape-determining protein MreD|tara:strand:- start:133 stop:702 length:570 start_codon:yes stop_codon:yes gene_type:complete